MRRLVVGFEEWKMTPALAARLRRLDPAGIVLLRRNIASPEALRRLLRDVRHELSRPLFVAVDHEGGPVLRFPFGVTVFPGNAALGTAGDPDLARAQGRAMALELRSFGIDVNFAPVLDLATNPDNPAVGIRSFGADPDLVARLGGAFVEGSQSAGVSACAKHFPGLGDAAVDPHLDLPVVRAGVSYIWFGFRTTELVMTTHVVVEGECATFSRKLVREVLRGEIGYEGVTITDDLEMGAMVKRFPWEEVCRRPIEAGHDLLLVCHREDRQQEAARALDECDRDERARARIERLLARPRPAPAPAPDATPLAREIARRAARVVRDPAGLLPLPREASVRLVLPSFGAEVQVEETAPGGGEDTLVALLAERFPALEARRTSCDPMPEEISRTAGDLGGREVVAFAAWNVRFHPGQRALACALERSGAPVVALLLRNPADEGVLPGRFACVTADGFREVQLRELVAILGVRPGV
jgi:beta-N-acetylhexosaminidase